MDVDSLLMLMLICSPQVDDKNLGPGPYYDRWQRLKQTEKLRESLEDVADSTSLPVVNPCCNLPQDLYEKYVPHLIL